MSTFEDTMQSDANLSLEQQEQQLELLQQQLQEQETLQQQHQQQMLAEQQEMKLQLMQDDMSRDSIPGDSITSSTHWPSSIPEKENDSSSKANDTQESNGIKRPASATSDEEPSTKKKSSEIDKLWSNVNENPSDFQAWTLLLQRIDQIGDLKMGELAYESFFKRYPYCYGYWKKYADLHKRKGTKASTMKVFNLGVDVIPLSVDLWCHFMEYVTVQYASDEDFIRQYFEKAVDKCGLEFKSDKLWDAYISWETNEKNYKNVMQIYERLLAVPISKYLTHWQKFQEFVKKYSPSEILGVDEYLDLKKQVSNELNPSTADTPDAAPPGEEADDSKDLLESNAEELKSIRKFIISARQVIYDKGAADAKARWNYEDSIKRPYFHVKPLEKSQLTAWRSYLEFEVKQGNLKRSRVLFERCLIACAFYEEFWMRYVRYLEDHEGTEDELRNVYEKGCTIHLTEKLRPHLSWAAFEEEKGNQDKAIEILEGVQKRIPGSLEAYMQAIGVERRRGNIGNAEKIFHSTLNMLKERQDQISFGQMTIKFARFLTLFKNDPESSVTYLEEALENDKLNTSLILSLVDHMLACRPPKLTKAAQLLKSCTSTAFPPTTRLMFAHRFMHFNTECGQKSSCAGEGLRLLREVQHEVRQIEAARIANEAEEGAENSNKQVELASTSQANVQEKKRENRQTTPVSDKSNYSGNNVNGASTINTTMSSNYQGYQQPNYTGYNQGYPQNYGGPPYQGWGYPAQQPNYGYGQQGWGGYTNYYGQR